MKNKSFLLILVSLLFAGFIFGCTTQNEPQENCTTEGGLILETEKPCCEGLDSAPCVDIINGQCATADCGNVCINCGDGICKQATEPGKFGENWCNCPEDCVKPLECIKEGELIGTMPVPEGMTRPECCEGLVEIGAIDETEMGTMVMTDVNYCTNCGDGICKSPENVYNCPEDCHECETAYDCSVYMCDCDCHPVEYEGMVCGIPGPDWCKEELEIGCGCVDNKCVFNTY